ncbi:MAG: DNA polymerase IV [Gammaproteobacteria bacterium]|nr:DNA polymerase IV [Gammaproteobacteria bacterium]MDH5802857.1 DNA polymerase IV [Gammaproteobacteria bacterium]
MIIHADMDAFFASVEIREQPHLADQPVVVGGSPQSRGVVAAANYIARRFGIHSAMPMSIAVKKCPHLVILPHRLDLYAHVSQQIRAIFERYTPLVEPLSLDEAFLDVAASERLYGSAHSIGRKIKQNINDELRLTVSIGIAPNKFIAKIASDVDKPDGFTVVTRSQVQDFLDPLPVWRIWGVGKVTEKSLDKLGIRTIAQLRAFNEGLLKDNFGEHGMQLWRLARGIDPRPVVCEHETKSISHETTFAHDITEREILLATLLQLTEQVAWRLRHHELRGRTVQLKIRYSDFKTVTRSHSLQQATDQTQVLWQTVKQIFTYKLPPKLPPVRLIGMGISNLSEPAQAIQQELLQTESSAQSKLDAVADSINAKFGKNSLTRARSFQSEKKQNPQEP